MTCLREWAWDCDIRQLLPVSHRSFCLQPPRTMQQTTSLERSTRLRLACSAPAKFSMPVPGILKVTFLHTPLDVCSSAASSPSMSLQAPCLPMQSSNSLVCL